MEQELGKQDLAMSCWIVSSRLQAGSHSTMVQCFEGYRFVKAAACNTRPGWWALAGGHPAGAPASPCRQAPEALLTGMTIQCAMAGESHPATALLSAASYS